LRQEDGEAAQDEQEGQRYDEARQPGAHHDETVERADGRHMAKVIRIACQTGQPSVTEKIAIIMPAKPIIEPTDRSNSPAIIKRQAPTAMIMNWAETVDQLMTPCARTCRCRRRKIGKGEDDHGADDAAQFRGGSEPCEAGYLLTRSSLSPGVVEALRHCV
jgi:hypothetical protein